MQTRKFAKIINVKMMRSDRATSESSDVVKEMEFMEQQTQNAYLDANQPQKVQNRATDGFISSKEKEERPDFLSEVLSEQKVEQTNVFPLQTSVSKRILDKTAAPQILLRRDHLLIPHNLLKVEKDSVTCPSTIPNLCLQGFKSQLRGGSPQGDNEESTEVNQSELIAKFEQYKQKVLNDTTLKRELNLFVEVLASRIPTNQDYGRAMTEHTSDENQPLELSFDIRRHFLSCEASEDSKILLLTGQAGSGKSLFCKCLQREILSEWYQNPEGEDRNWFPIYVELSSLKNPKSEAISESLTRELSLTKEEILLLQAPKQSNPHLPRLLFIFDGYDAIEDFHALHSLTSRQDFLEKNFSMLNKIEDASWKDAKFIITCREENLQKVQRREMLFAPLITSEASELSAVPGSFLQRKIGPFSDEQITCYLKKYYYYASKDTIEEGSSWNQVKKLETMIDNHQLREIARTPFMLWIICQIQTNLARNELEQINEVKPNLLQKLSRRFLIDSFLNEVIRSRAKERLSAFNNLDNKEEHKDIHKEDQKVNLHMRKMQLQAQDLALKLRGYSIIQAENEHNENDDPSTLKLHPLVKWDDNHSQVKFGYPFLLEFFVAKSIEEEIKEAVVSTQDEQLEIKKELLINQRLLTRETSDAAVIFFLIDAIKDERLTANQFINLIYLSRQKELDQKKDGESIKDEHSSSKWPFTVAAANAITILNAAGYDFSHKDLSYIRIPGANLSFGVFEGTNFANSNLQGVDFTEAWLRDANFVKANLEHIELGAIRRLKLQNEKIKNIAYSANGDYFAVDVGAETVIFENVGIRKVSLKEKRRFPGYFLSWGALDGAKAVTIVGEQILTEEKQSEEIEDQDDQKEKLNVCFCTWDAKSGQSLEKFNIPMGNRKFLNFDPDRKEVIAFGNQMVQKYDIASQSWIEFAVKICNDVKTRNLFARNSNTLLVGDYLRNTILCSIITGKAILKQRQTVASCKLSPDGQKMVAGTSHGVIHISDCVRGYIIKSLVNQTTEEVEDDDNEEDDDNYEDNDEPKTVFDCSFIANREQILSRTRKRFTLQDIADLTSTDLALHPTKSNSFTYCLSPNSQQIAVVEKSHTVSFKKFPAVADLSIQTPAIRGTNNKGLNLQGIIVNNNATLPDENIAFFQEKGNYGIFHEIMIKKLFSNSPTDSEDVREVVLIGEKLAPIHARIIGSDLLWINLQRLDLSKNDIGEEGGRVIGSNITWANLEELILILTEVGDETAKAIANNQNFQKLKKLQLAFNKIGDIGAEAIGKNEIWTSLEILDLSKNKIKDDGALAIGTNKIWKKLVTLDLSSNQISDNPILIFLCSNKSWEHLQSLLLIGNPALLGTNDICKILEGIASKSLKMLVLPHAKFEEALLQCLKHPASEDVINLSLAKSGYNDIHAEIIAEDITFTNLKKLDLSKNLISDKGGIKIGRNTSWINFEELDLSGNNLGAKTAVAIGDNTTWSKLRVLNLKGNKIGCEGSYAIGNNKIWTELQTLELQDNLIGSKGFVALCQNKTWNKLQTLNLEKNLIDAEGAAELARNTSWINLQTLHLGGNSIGAEGAAELARNTSWINLQTLHLYGNSIGAEGAAELARNTSWINLQTLHLGRNSIGAEGAAELARNTSWINLQTLGLESNSIGAEGAAELARNTSWINLQTLHLGSNSIGDKGAAELARDTPWINLQTLHLGSNSIGGKGAAELARNTSWINLQTLHLKGNSIGAEGAAELARNTSWINLQTLHLGRNSIGDKGAAELARNTSWINLQTLHLGSNSIGDKGAAELARNTFWINLQTLHLESNSIGAEGVAELARNTSWINLQTLHLGSNSIGAEGAAELARNTSWINLQTLHLESNSIGDKGAAELARNTSWINLQTLGLGYNSIGAEGAAELARNTSWINLQTLDLESNSIGDKGAAELARNTSWINLQTLHLGSNSIGAEGAAELARNTSWINLQTLHLESNSIGDKGAAELARNTSWINLQTLHLYGNSIGAEGAAELARNTSWINLQTLHLYVNSIGAEGAAELARDTPWINLQTLHLGYNSIGAEGAAELARNTSWINLQTLDLESNSIGAEGAAELARNTSWINLQTLHLGRNSIGAEGAAELARNTSWINLQTLHLGRNSIGAEGAAELARNTSWINLQTLHLGRNSIGDKGAAELARNTSWINLQTLDLESNSIGAEGAAELARNTSWINLQTLYLGRNSIGDKGAAELARNTSWINLQTLHLKGNSIGAEGAAELARNTSWINLQTLHLGSNSIGDKGAAELARNTFWINLQTLHLESNSIGAEGVAELARNTSWINLQTLHLGSNSIGAEGAAELARNTSWINLQTLHLESNSIGDKGAAELARNTSWINLQTLGLGYNSIGAEGAAELARNTSWINLQTLELRDNSIGAEGAAELAKNTFWPKTLKINY